MSKNNKSVGNFPPLRFKGFGGEWTKNSLGKFAEIFDGTHQTPKYVKFGIPFVSVENIGDLAGTEKYITPEAFETEYKIKPQTGDILMTRITAGIIGSTAIVKNDNPLAYYVSLALIRIKNESLKVEYLNHFISTSFFKRELHKRIIHIAFPKKINLGEINHCFITVPDECEQRRIASFLSLIGQRIQTQIKIIEELKALKSGLSSNIFMRKVKLAEHEEKWVPVQLKEALTIPEKIKPSNIDKNKLLTVKLHLKGISRNDNSDTLSIGSTNYYVRKKGQLIYGKQNLFNGALAIVSEEFDSFLSSGDVPALDIISSKIDPEFLFQYISRPSFYKRLESIASGSGSKRIHENDLLSQSITVPSIEGQQKIASILSAIDKKIKLETKHLELLKQQKQYFLQNLFI
ncbi:restriction endonuclease subunit S [Algoriphagus sp. Y33]|uniref:restriction endonuclease subunit S n=2 Tax=unclassified Algoriphagus TaxID=2641541 RepID=UPI001783BD4A|nr:restriction endonuclease subunit S [Algoriphagus sp. Y33]